MLNTDATHTHAQDRPSGGPLVVDAHLDVAWNAIHYSRELSLTVDEIRASEPVQPAVAMTSLHAFSQASIAVVFATLFAYPAEAGDPGIDLHLARAIKGYRTAAEAEQQALEMLSIYNRWEDQGRIRIIRSRDSLEAHLLLHQQDRVPGFLILMEGAEPIRAPELLPDWFERGVRMIGLAWQSTSYAGGTGSTDGLTDRGRELLRAMADLKIIHDASHLSEEAFWESAGLPHRGLCVTHANVRKLMLPRPGGRVTAPLNRHLSDEQIAEVARGHGAATRGVIGLVLLNESLDPRWTPTPEGRGVRVTLAAQTAAHVKHLARIAGWESVGIGSDVDAGLGRAETPEELDSVADWALLADLAPDRSRADFLGGNWLRFLRETLPC